MNVAVVAVDGRYFYDEGLRCISAGAPNGAVSMFRNTLAYIVQDKGSPTAKARGDLKNKLQTMVAEGSIHPSLGDWVTHVRLYGNAGAHPEQFGKVSALHSRTCPHPRTGLLSLVSDVRETTLRTGHAGNQHSSPTP